MFGCDHCKDKEPCMALHVNPSGVLTIVCKHTRKRFKGLVPLHISAAFCDGDVKAAKISSFWLPVVADTDAPFELHGGVTNEFEPADGDLVDSEPDEPLDSGY